MYTIRPALADSYDLDFICRMDTSHDKDKPKLTAQEWAYLLTRRPDVLVLLAENFQGELVGYAAFKRTGTKLNSRNQITQPPLSLDWMQGAVRSGCEMAFSEILGYVIKTYSSVLWLSITLHEDEVFAPAGDIKCFVGKMLNELGFMAQKPMVAGDGVLGEKDHICFMYEPKKDEKPCRNHRLKPSFPSLEMRARSSLMPSNASTTAP